MFRLGKESYPHDLYIFFQEKCETTSRVRQDRDVSSIPQDRIMSTGQSYLITQQNSGIISLQLCMMLTKL